MRISPSVRKSICYFIYARQESRKETINVFSGIEAEIETIKYRVSHVLLVKRDKFEIASYCFIKRKLNEN